MGRLEHAKLELLTILRWLYLVAMDVPRTNPVVRIASANGWRCSELKHLLLSGRERPRMLIMNCLRSSISISSEIASSVPCTVGIPFVTRPLRVDPVLDVWSYLYSLGIDSRISSLTRGETIYYLSHAYNAVLECSVSLPAHGVTQNS